MSASDERTSGRHISFSRAKPAQTTPETKRPHGEQASTLCRLVLTLALALAENMTVTAQAQEVTPQASVESATEAETETQTDTAAAPPLAHASPVLLPAATTEAPSEPPRETQVDAEPAAPDEAASWIPKLNIGLGVRSGLSVSKSSGSKTTFSLQDGLVDQLLVRPYMNAQITKNVAVVANLEIMTKSVTFLDVILQLKFADEFQLWIGQHIPANDRNNTSGPFYVNNWHFPLAVHEYPFDQGARDRGFTFWGFLGGGVLKYHLSMVDLQTGRNIDTARLSGRVTLNLLDPENYFYCQGTYYGTQDTLALGGVISYQKGAAGGTDIDGDGKVDNDFLGLSADLLFEKNLGALGTITLEGGYWNFKGTGKDYLVNQGTIDKGIGYVGAQGGLSGQSLLASVSWLSPNKVGVGRLQPIARLQFVDNERASNVKVFDASLGYIVDGFNHRWFVSYQRVEQEKAPSGNAFSLGAQVQI